MTTWQTMRVVVELPINGKISETNLCNILRDALDAGNIEKRLPINVAGVGRPRVKSYRRVVQRAIQNALDNEIANAKTF